MKSESLMMKNQTKVIFHIDLNAFYASCQLIEDPYLKGKAFIVGGSAVTKRGVVLTASYEARKYGIRSGMNVKDAFDLYPHVLVAPTRFDLYKRHSKIFFDYIKTFTHKMMKASIDEAYLDMTHHKDPVSIAKTIQKTLNDTYHLPNSIGIAPTLFLAKMASDMKKPLGITILRKRDIVDKLFPLPLKDLYGLGRKTYPKFIEEGIITIGDFTKKTNHDIILNHMSEDHYQSFLTHIYGNSTNIIDDDYQVPKSISQESTLNYDIDQEDLIIEMMQPLIEDALKRLEKHQLYTKTIGFKLKTNTFKLQTRSKTLMTATNDLSVIKEAITELFMFHYNHEPIRLIGITLSNFVEDSKPFNLFTYHLFQQGT